MTIPDKKNVDLLPKSPIDIKKPVLDSTNKKSDGRSTYIPTNNPSSLNPKTWVKSPIVDQDVPNTNTGKRKVLDKPSKK